MNTRLYAAYGSNLNRKYWAEWCKKKNFDPESIKPVGTAWLPDVELVFDYRSTTWDGGVLNLLPRTGNLVPVGLFTVTEDGHKALDKKEGAPDYYKRDNKTALTMDGKTVDVFTYIVCDKRRSPDGFVRPNDKYVEVVLEGYKAFEFDASPLNAAVKGEPCVPPVSGLFVYGTLMRLQPRFRVLERYGVSCALLAQCPGVLFDCGAYPGMVTGNPTNCVQGEFIRLDNIDNAILQLDRIEGFNGFGVPDSLFERRLIEVDLCDGHTRLAWTYQLSRADELPAIASGDWRKHHGVKDLISKRLISSHVGDNELEAACRLTARTPFESEDMEKAKKMLPLWRQLSAHAISERELAQISGQWAVLTRCG